MQIAGLGAPLLDLVRLALRFARRPLERGSRFTLPRFRLPGFTMPRFTMPEPTPPWRWGQAAVPGQAPAGGSIRGREASPRQRIGQPGLGFFIRAPEGTTYQGEVQGHDQNLLERLETGHCLINPLTGISNALEAEIGLHDYRFGDQLVAGGDFRDALIRWAGCPRLACSLSTLLGRAIPDQLRQDFDLLTGAHSVLVPRPGRQRLTEFNLRRARAGVVIACDTHAALKAFRQGFTSYLTDPTLSWLRLTTVIGVRTQDLHEFGIPARGRLRLPPVVILEKPKFEVQFTRTETID